MEMHTRESLLRTHGITCPDNPPAKPIRNWLTRLWRSHREERRIRRQIDTLDQCSDWIQRDIGIARGEIAYIVRHGAGRDGARR